MKIKANFLLILFIALLAIVDVLPSLAEDTPAQNQTTLLSPEEFQSTVFLQLKRLDTGKGSVQELTVLLVDYAEQVLVLPAFLDPSLFLMPEFTESLGTELFQRVSLRLKEKEVNKLIGLKSLSERLLPRSDKRGQAIIRMFALAEKIEFLVAVGKTEEILSLSASALSENEQNLIAARTAKALLPLATAQIKRKRPISALETLASIASEYWDEEFFNVSTQAIEAIEQSAEDEASFSRLTVPNKKLSQLLEEAAKRNEQAREQLITFFSGLVKKCLEEKNENCVETTFYRVIDLRPDPSSVNDDLRIQIIAKSVDSEMQYFPGQLINELKMNNRLGWGRKVQLLLAGYYGKVFHVIFYIAISVSVISLAVAFYLPFQRARKQREESVMLLPERKTVLDEYQELLAVFGLRENATEDEIKQAYRQAVKSYHPDSHHGSSEEFGSEMNEKFLNLKNIYERILEIKRSRFH